MRGFPLLGKIVEMTGAQITINTGKMIVVVVSYLSEGASGVRALR